MTDENTNPGEGAPAQTTGQAPPTTATTTAPPETPAQPKVEVGDDGKVIVDGKKYVRESDLIAAKTKLENEITQLRESGNPELVQTRQELSKSQEQVAQLTAKLETAQQAGAAGATNQEEVAKLKTELESAQTTAKEAQGKILDLRRNSISQMYRVPEEQLKEKTAEQLDALEEALRTVKGQGGPGAYALGGFGGGTNPPTDMDRARAVLENTPVRGVRNAQPTQ